MNDIIDILVPNLPESVVDATVSTWHKRPNETVIREEVLVEIETDKVILEISASANGVLKEILEDEGATVTSSQILGRLLKDNNLCEKSLSVKNRKIWLKNQSNKILSPATHRLLIEHNIDASDIEGTGARGRITRKDVERYILKKNEKSSVISLTKAQHLSTRDEKRVPMSNLRKCIAQRLLEAKNSTAMLTTFNEVNMKTVIDIRKQYGEIFEKRHGIKLGFMSFYVKATVEALKRYPEINASIDGNDIIYHNYFDVSIAISTSRGLVTPVLRNADDLSMADIENKIKELSIKAQNSQLTVEDLTGGIFTITNGGIFGSLISTPIINPPQSAILGIHVIKDRPSVVDGRIEILPLVYLALSYDHRLIDGRESVSFLITIKELLEDPIRLLLNI